jgi:type VI secretion system secreted protein VgrG
MGTTGGSGTGSATLGTSTTFAGNILALDSITLTTTADILCGRAIALNGAVTMDTNMISNNNTAEDFDSGRSDFGSYGFSGGSTALVPEPSTMLLLSSGLVGLVAFRKRFEKA